MLPLENTPTNVVYPTGKRFVLLMIALYISMFLVALVCPTRTSTR